MTTETRLLTVPFAVPDGFNHTWVITHHSDICAITGVQGDTKAALTTGRLGTQAGPENIVDAANEHHFAKSCFQDWLAEAIAEMGRMCKEE